MMREVHIRYKINEDSPIQLFTAKVFERFLEEGLPKLFAKAFTKKVVEELEAKTDIDGLVEPMLFFEEDGEIVRAAIPDEENEEDGPATVEDLKKLFHARVDSQAGESIEVVNAKGTNELIDALEEK